MLPLRRKQSPQGEGGTGGLSPDDNTAYIPGTATNYLSFQDAAADTNEQDGQHQQQGNGRQRDSRHRWFGNFGRNNQGGSVGDGTNRRNNTTHTHRGFTTSIHDMFQSPEMERVDCCALTCCGILQSDRDRYFLQGVTPPSLVRRLWLHVLFPVFLFSIAGYAAMRIPDPVINQIFTTGTVLLLLLYLVLQCFKGRHKRIEIRKDLLWTKAQLLDQRRQNLSVVLEQERPDDHGRDQEYYLGQTKGDFFAAHPFLCSCYADDRLIQQDWDENDRASFCTGIWEWMCAPWCGMHLQCCGICALAQEGREVETAILPRSYLLVDYITMQPYADYYPAIYRARHEVTADENEETFDQPSFVPPLSRLSKQLLQVLATLVCLLILWTIGDRYFWKYVVQANIPAWRMFGWPDLFVFSATWLHAVGLLTILVWLTNRPKDSQVSMDAIIKYFAAGFCLSTALAIFWELLLGIFLKLLVTLCLALTGTDTTQRPDSQLTFLHRMGRAVGDDGSSSYLQTFGNDHPLFYTVYLLIASFFLAAFVEELCKYFGYRMVEHPDFLSKRDMEDAMNVVYGEFEEEPDENRQERHDFSKQRRSLQAYGAGVTVAMIAVAMGFTCCENLVYVFIYSGSSLELEFSVLLARAFFPVHALAAALQSLGVVERDVEGSRGFHLGRIILPALLFHGSYDFFILWIDFLAERNGVYADSDESSILEWPVLLSFTTSVLVVAAALWFYMQRARQQRRRLSDLDQDQAAARSSLI